jgi:hypothetical protein
LLVIVLVIIVIIAIVSMALLLPWKVTNVEETRTAAVVEGTSEIDLSLDQSVGKVAFSFSSGVQDQVTMTVKGQIRQNLLASGDPLQITWTYDFVGQRLILNADVDTDAYSTTYGHDELVTTVTIPSQLSTSINVTGATGSVELVAGDGVVLRAGHLSETAGSVHAQLTNCSLEGAFLIETTAGSSELDWTEVHVLEGVEVSISTTTGGVEMNVLQTTALGGNVSVSASANTGGVKLHLSIEGQTSARVASSANLGSVSVEGSVGFTGSNEDLRSNNYPSQEKMDFAIDANLGGVELNLQYLA